jgi:hypothetical protein
MNDAEARLREQAEKAQEQVKYENAKMQGGALHYGEAAMLKRESLTQRFHSALARKRRDQAKIDQLNELTYLLDKHPEVARIMDLIDALGNDF